MSERLVSAPRSHIRDRFLFWVAWNPKKGAYPKAGMWRMSVWVSVNVVGIMSGARLVYPKEASLAFAAYDGLFEVVYYMLV